VSEFIKTFETLGGVTVEQALAFAVLILPGFISLRVYDMRRGGEGRKINDVLLDVIVYSFATDLVAFVALAIVSAVVPGPLQSLVKGLVALAVLIIVPVCFAVLWFALQQALIRSGVFPDTLTKPWNRMVDRIARERLDVGVILTLRDGRTIGAKMGAPRAFASDDDDLLLGEVWTIAADRATFVQASPGSCGIIVSRADCQTIEFVEL
jgi:hypothetical protein